MVRTKQPIRSVFKSMLSQGGNLKARNDTTVFYIGRGDQFDDDRRLVCGSEDDMHHTRPAYALNRDGRAEGRADHRTFVWLS